MASDAIGLGLNLNIRRIIFHSIYSYDPVIGGRAMIKPSRIKQLAGAPPCWACALCCIIVAVHTYRGKLY